MRTTWSSNIKEILSYKLRAYQAMWRPGSPGIRLLVTSRHPPTPPVRVIVIKHQVSDVLRAKLIILQEIRENIGTLSKKCCQIIILYSEYSAMPVSYRGGRCCGPGGWGRICCGCSDSIFGQPRRHRDSLGGWGQTPGSWWPHLW